MRSDVAIMPLGSRGRHPYCTARERRVTQEGDEHEPCTGIVRPLHRPSTHAMMWFFAL